MEAYGMDDRVSRLGIGRMSLKMVPPADSIEITKDVRQLIQNNERIAMYVYAMTEKLAVRRRNEVKSMFDMS